MTDLEYARAFFEKDTYAVATTGIVIEDVSQGHSVISLKVDGRHKNAFGLVMGAVYTTMSDFAFAVAANYNRPATVTLQTSAAFLHQAKGDTLYAEAEVIHDGGKTCVCEIHVTDNAGTDILRVTTTGYKLSVPVKKTPEEIASEPNPYLRYR